MVEDGGCYVVGSCRCPRSRPGYANVETHPVMSFEKLGEFFEKEAAEA